MIADFLAAKLETGPLRVGQVLVHPDFRLHHVGDSPEAALEHLTDPEEAARIARTDSHGAFRPLKTAPTLRRGWLLALSSLSEVRTALDLLYPAAAGKALAFSRGEFRPSDLRETLGRQTGMYALTKNITDADAAACIRTVCDQTTNCLNSILWNIAPGIPTPRTVAAPPADPLPLLCSEACPLLLAAAKGSVNNS